MDVGGGAGQRTIMSASAAPVSATGPYLDGIIIRTIKCAFNHPEIDMRATVTLDDDLLERASALSGVTDRGPLLRAALSALVERESARRLAALGGSEPDLDMAPRRRPA